MNRKRILGFLLAAVLAVSLLPMSALAVSNPVDDLQEIITDEWDSHMLLFHGENGMPGYFLMPSEYNTALYRLVSARNTTGDIAKIAYDTKGNLIKVSFTGDTSQSEESWQYDSYNRVINHTSTYWSENDNGVMEQIWNVVVKTTYDSQSRPSTESVYTTGYSYVVTYTYDGNNHLVKEEVRADDGSGVTDYTYKGNDLVKAVYEGDGVKEVTVYTYENGLLAEETTTVSRAETGSQYEVSSVSTIYYAYDSEGRLVNRKSDLFEGESTRIFGDEYQWTFFQDGKLNKEEYVFEFINEEGVSDLASMDCTIDYDNAGRVSKVVANGYVHTYSYDDMGNNIKIAIVNQEDRSDSYDITFTYEPIAVQPDVQTGTNFSDVPSTAYYADAVAWAEKEGVTAGTGNGMFSPNKTCTRGQVVTFLWRAMGQPEANVPNPFTDVKPGDYFFEAVLWAVDQGVTAGTGDGKFNPDAPCTRGQVVTFLWRAMGQPPAGNAANPFTDVKPGDYYYDAVLWAVDQGVTTGTSETTFSPGATCTRAQVVTFLYRALG